MYQIFISYRHYDTAHVAGRIYDHLERGFSNFASVFIDIEKNHAGNHFPDRIKNTINEAQVFLAVIGQQWLSIEDVYGNRRLDNEDDWVRKEIALALKLRELQEKQLRENKN